MSTTLELLRTMVRQQTTGIGSVVDNLIGPDSPAATPITSSQDNRWQVVQLPGVLLPTLDEFYQRFAADTQRTSQEVQVQNGLLTLTATQPTIYCVRGLLTVPASTSITLSVSTLQGSTAVYVDGSLVRSGTGDRAFQFTLGEGQRLVEVLVASRVAALQLPFRMPVTPASDILTAPSWVDVSVGYADVQAGTAAINLKWATDVRAGGWIILRREHVALGLIVNVSEATRYRTFGIELDGDVEEALPPGTSVFVGAERIGTVLQSTYDATATRTYNTVPYTGLTLVQLQLPNDRSDPSQYWLGTTCSVGVLQELHRLARTTASPFWNWTDTGVSTGVAYEYALQAYGLFNATTLGPLSPVVQIIAGDYTPPASITLGTIEVLNQVMHIPFTTPADTDYAGMRVILNETKQTGTVLSATSTSVTLDVAPASDPTNWRILVTGGTGVGQEQLILSAAGAVLTTGDWETTLDGTSTFSLHEYTALLTDYGIPNSLDQVTLAVPMNGSVPRYGTLHFPTFDVAGNSQDVSEAASWVYDGSTDETFTENQPPIVGIRQLTATQQAALVTDTRNTAVVELTATDPIDGTTGVIIQYRGRARESGTATAASADTLHDTTKSWTNGEWAGFLLQIIGGTGAGQERTITTNFATQVVISEDWVTLPDGTSEYEIAWRTGLSASAGNTVLDNPTGTRSRLVTVSRTGTDNWIQVRAQDQDGLYSDVLSYAPDFDALPEFSNVEVSIDALEDQVNVVGVVDDDTRSVQWWLDPAAVDEPDSGSPAMPAELADLTIVKSFRFNFSLEDGERKTLYIRPFTGTDGQGLEGIDFEKEISRSPRTTVAFDNRSDGGGLSASYVRASFQSRPPITDATTATAVDSATAKTLYDASAGWTPNAWATDRSAYQVYYVRVISGTGVGQIRRIVSNDATRLTIDLDWDVIPAASDQYVIQRGATLYRILADPSGSGPFLPTGCKLADGTVNPVFIQRQETDQYLEYYTELSGAPAEAPHRVRIDPDDMAEVYNIIAEDDGDEIVVSLGDYDEDVRRWQLYAKRGGQPILSTDGGADPLSAGQPLDMDFQRCDLLVSTAEQIRFHVATGTWYLILVPFNSYNEPGPRLGATVVVTGTPSTVGLLSLLTVSAHDNGAAVYNKISWSHNSVLNGSQATYTVRVYGYMVSQGVGSEVEITTGGRMPSLDVGAADWVNSDDTNDTEGIGSILHYLPYTSRTSSGISRSWQYRVDLCTDSGATVVATYNLPLFTDKYLSTAPTFSSGAVAAVANGGTCSNLA